MADTRTCEACGQQVGWTPYCARCGAAAPPKPELEIDPRVAGFWPRAVARVVDGAFGLFVGVISLNLAVIVLAIRGTPGEPEQWLQSMSGFSATNLAFSIAGSLCYYTTSEWIGAATVGKLVCGLRVVSQDFERVSLAGAAVRSAAFLVDALFFGIVAYAAMDGSSLRQRLGDRWGSTVVVKRARFPEAGRGAVRVVLGCLLGTGAWSGIHAYALVVRVPGAA